MSYAGYNPSTDMGDLSSKVILITGGTNGIGKMAVLEFAQHNPGHIYFTGRNEAAAQEVISQCPGANVSFIPCDLTDLASVHAAADSFTSSRLDIFIANAGIMAGPPGLTKDGYEVQFGINHIGNTALLMRLLPIMEKTTELPDTDVRFVSLTSLGYKMHPSAGIEFNTLKSTQEHMLLGAYGRYGQSKLANVLTAREVRRRYPKIASVAIHPGVVKTELVTKLGFVQKAMVYVTNPGGLMSPRQGCYNTLWAATSDEMRTKMEKGNVAVFEPVGKATCGTAKCWDNELAQKLWDWTEKEVGIKSR